MTWDSQKSSFQILTWEVETHSIHIFSLITIPPLLPLKRKKTPKTFVWSYRIPMSQTFYLIFIIFITSIYIRFCLPLVRTKLAWTFLLTSVILVIRLQILSGRFFLLNFIKKKSEKQKMWFENKIWWCHIKEKRKTAEIPSFLLREKLLYELFVLRSLSPALRGVISFQFCLKLDHSVAQNISIKKNLTQIFTALILNVTFLLKEYYKRLSFYFSVRFYV